MRIEAIVPTEEMVRAIYALRQDFSVRNVSLHENPISFELFMQRFRADYSALSDLSPFFLLDDDGNRVAFVRFRPFCTKTQKSFVRSAEISIIVPENFRGRGFGYRALMAAEQMAFEKMYHELYAYIMPHNDVSTHLFEKAGYVPLGTIEIQRQEIEGIFLKNALLYKKTLHEPPEFPHVFLIAEIGSNWQVGSKEERKQLARLMIQEAASAGVDAIKFQTFRSETVYAHNAKTVSYMDDTDINELFSDLEMAYEDIPLFEQVAKDAGVFFMSTPFSVADFEAVDPYVQYHKVASYELCYTPLLQKMAQSKKPVFVSTGASSPHEISYAVDYLKKEGCKKIILMQCTAAYPAPDSSMNLSCIPTLRQSFGVDVGLSDHSLSPFVAPTMAVSLGACAIEKHVTHDKKLPGPDQSFALDMQELRQFVKQVRAAESMFGSPEKQVHKAEEELYRFAKRRLQAVCDIEPGQIIQEGVNAALLRPGKNSMGAHPTEAFQIFGRKIEKGKKKGDGIILEDFL